MVRTGRTLALLAGVLAFAAPRAPADGAPAKPACSARPTGVPAARLASLGRGFNLPGWLDRKPGIAPDLAALRALRARGFTHVRLPVKAEYYLIELTPADAVAAQSRDLSRAVDALLGLGFAVSLDMHPGEGLAELRRRDPDRAFALLDGLWRRLARSFADRSPERIFFEILNEPASPDEYARAVRMARTVREAAPAHTIILGPAQDQRVEALENLRPIGDRNTVYAIHFYDPMAFSHQGLDWSGPEEPLTHFRGVPFPSSRDHPAVTALHARLLREGKGAAAAALTEQLANRWDAAEIDRTFARAEAWAVRHGATVIVNEFGVLSWHAPPADRARWLKAVRDSAERHCIGWVHWDYADGFGFMLRSGGRDIPDRAVLDSLIEPGAVTSGQPAAR